jgi:hypothetical protein
MTSLELDVPEHAALSPPVRVQHGPMVGYGAAPRVEASADPVRSTLATLGGRAGAGVLTPGVSWGGERVGGAR